MWIILLIVSLIFIDKALTFASIKSVEKNFPQIDKFSIEKNPLARWFFEKTGLVGGTILYFFISLITIYFAWVLISMSLKLFKVANHPTIALYIIVMIYFLVIGNNLFQLMRYNKIIP